MKPKPQPGQIYKHFKGNFYKVIAIARDHETGKENVVYHSNMTDIIWVRPLDDWLKDVRVSGKTLTRFEYIPDPVTYFQEKEKDNTW